MKIKADERIDDRDLYEQIRTQDIERKLAPTEGTVKDVNNTEY
jgi:hypothetical protein